MLGGMNPTPQSEGAPPAPPRVPDPPEVLQRRRFLSRVSLALSAAAAAIVGVPVVGFLFAPLLRRVPREWRPVGRVADFAVGETVAVAFDDASPLPWAGVTARTAAWLRRDEGEGFTAFAVNCTHLGCPVRWIQGAELFLCPCHGGVFNKDGSVAAGPPPRPLTRYPVRVRGGRVEIQTAPTPIA
jgi:menaquinol-cytochrome c reductase iron-sulfur subunit